MYSIFVCTQQAMHVGVEKFTTEIIMLIVLCNVVPVCALDVCIFM